MTTTMKGLLKGLRYISQIFEADDDDDEPEMQIGHPTDVKHVAHIGLDGPSSNSPSWMNGFEQKSDPFKLPSPKQRYEEANRARNADMPEIPKPRRNPSMDITLGNNEDHHTEEQKHARRRHHSAGGSLNSGQELPDKSKTSRRSHRSSKGDEEGSVSRASRKKKSSKESSSSAGEGSRRGGSTRPKKAQQNLADQVPPYPDNGS